MTPIREEISRLKAICDDKALQYVSSFPEHSYEVTACNTFPSALEALEVALNVLERCTTFTEGGEEFYPIRGEEGAREADEAIARIGEIMGSKA